MELKDIEQRLLTRFKWGLSAQLVSPDYETKLKIIRAKSRKVGARISDEVVTYLADNISANVREIEGVLSSLVANASFLERKITVSLAKEVLKISYVTVKNGKEAQPSRFVEELHPKKKETQGGTNKSGFY